MPDHKYLAIWAASIISIAGTPLSANLATILLCDASVVLYSRCGFYRRVPLLDWQVAAALHRSRLSWIQRVHLSPYIHQHGLAYDVLSLSPLLVVNRLLHSGHSKSTDSPSTTGEGMAAMLFLGRGLKTQFSPDYTPERQDAD